LAKVLIATLWNSDAVLLSVTKIGPERLILLVDQEPKDKQADNLKMIKNSIGRVVDVKEIKCKTYDIVNTAQKVSEIIDMQPRDDTIYINITEGRKTMALGLLFGAYSRPKRVRKIAYNPEEDQNSIVYLPKLDFQVNDSQKKLLGEVEGLKYENFTELAKKLDTSRAMLYRNIIDLEKMELIEIVDKGKIRITDAGKIAGL
jgi:CRISPR locus-related DNA-binding protein